MFWRDFHNRRQVGGYFGLTGTPYDSGDSRREQGIGKAATAALGTAARSSSPGCGLRYQPDSVAELDGSKERVGDQKGSSVKRIAIVALARKLMVALWRFLHPGAWCPRNTHRAGCRTAGCSRGGGPCVAQGAE